MITLLFSTSLPPQTITHPRTIFITISQLEGFPGGASGKDSTASAGDVWDLSSIPGSGRSLGVQSQGMASHSNIPAWRIPWTEESGGLQSIGSQRVGHGWSDLAHTHQLESSFSLMIAFINITYCVKYFYKTAQFQHNNTSGGRYRYKSSEHLILFPKNLFLFTFFGLVTRHVGSQLPDQRLNPCPLKWKHGVLTTGQPEISPCFILESPGSFKKLHRLALRSCD